MARQHSPISMLFARRVAPVGMTSVGWLPAPSDRLSFGQAAHVILTVGALVASGIGCALDTPGVSILMGATILFFGLPHGTLDLALIRMSQSDSKVFAVVALYLGCAAAMYALWRINPGVALLMFFCLSIRHFAEDWTDCMPPLFAHGTVIALMTASALSHPATLESLFAFLIGGALAAIVVDVAVLIAPVAIAIAGVGVTSLWVDGQRTSAVATGLSLAGMIWLPPLVGFTLFFCLMHSPTQFSAGLDALGWQRSRQWTGVVVPLTLAALGIAAAVYVALPAKTVPQAMVVTAFVTLSVLTLPHMIVPIFIRRVVTTTAEGPYRENLSTGA